MQDHIDSFITELAKWLQTWKASKSRKKALEKLGMKDEAKVDALEMTKEGALEEVKQKLEKA